MPGKLELSMLQIKADIVMAKAAISEAKVLPAKEAKYIKGQAGYHLQQASEKLVKIQLYASGKNIDPAKVYKHKIDELLAYASSEGINVIIPAYINSHAVMISSWEAEGRYDLHFVVKITQLEKCYTEVIHWYEELKQKGFK